MTEPWQQTAPPMAPEQAVGKAIQELTAARLGRGFVPLGLLLVAGAWQHLQEGAVAEAFAMTLGAPLAGLAMLAYGLRVSQKAFGHSDRPWMGAAVLGSVIPPFFGLYTVGGRGLRVFVGGTGGGGFAEALFFVLAGGWAMQSWMKVVEVERLSRVMAGGIDGGARL